MGSEQTISRQLRGILAELPVGAEIPESEQYRTLLSGLEFFLPGSFAEIEELDGIIPLFSRKTGEMEADIFGLCILINDQTVTPFQVRLQVSSSGSEITWLQCRFGERGDHGMMRTPYDLMHKATKKLLLVGDPDKIKWMYRATIGKRHHSVSKPPASLPAFSVGQQVRVIVNERNRTARTGIIRDITWHHKDQRYNYYINKDDGKKLAKRYFEEDLEAL